MAYIWKISVVQFGNATQIAGVILEGRPFVIKETQNSKSIFSIVSTSYFRQPFAGKNITISANAKKYNTITDNHGGFSVELDQQTIIDVKVFYAGESKPLEIIQSYPVYFNETDTLVNVISDIDDTILVSYTASFWKRIKTTLFVPPLKRKAVSFTLELLKSVQNNDGRIFYVSKSESNLFSLLSSFIEKNNIPPGILFLTPYLRFNQLFHSKKGKGFKEQTISKIIDRAANKKFVLIGDDTQQDMAVYERIAEKYPNRIIKIYIRKTRKNLVGNKREMVNKLISQSVPFLYFSDQDKVSDEIDYLRKYQNTSI